jgi:hypothetical protein
LPGALQVLASQNPARFQQVRAHLDQDPRARSVTKIAFLDGLDESYNEPAYEKMLYYGKLLHDAMGRGWFKYRVDGGYGWGDNDADTVGGTQPAKLVVAQLKDHGHVTRGWLGVQIQPVTAGIADSLGLKKAEGAMVDEPQKGSPAAEAGIESGDIITAVNGTKVKDARELARTIGMLAPNTKAKLDIIRQGQEKSLTVTVGEMSNEHQAKADTEQGTPTSDVPHLGLSLARISHTTECIGVANQRKPLCRNNSSSIRGAPRCRQSVARIPLDLNLLKAARW